MRLLGQQGQQLGVRLGEGLRGFLIQFGQVIAGDLQAEHIAKEVLNGRIRSMQLAFEVADQAGEARATEPASDHFGGKGRVVNTLTTLTPIPLGRMFSDHEGFGYQLRLLNDFLLSTGHSPLPVVGNVFSTRRSS